MGVSPPLAIHDRHDVWYYGNTRRRSNAQTARSCDRPRQERIRTWGGKRRGGNCCTLARLLLLSRSHFSTLRRHPERSLLQNCPERFQRFVSKGPAILATHDGFHQREVPLLRGLIKACMVYTRSGGRRAGEGGAVTLSLVDISVLERLLPPRVSCFNLIDATL